MISSWRRRRSERRAAKKLDLELIVPNHFLCPISLQLMKDPVTLSTGATYDRDSIERWIDAGNSTCPITNQPLTNPEPVPNHSIRKLIQDWCVQNRSHGVERVPTPRIPIASSEVAEILSRIGNAEKLDELEKCRDLVNRIEESAKESERNRRCIAANGASGVLTTSFDAFSRKGNLVNESADLLEDILSALMVITPLLDDDATSRINLSTPESLRNIVWLMRFGNLSGRRNAVLVLRAILSSDQDLVDRVVEIEGALEALMQLIKEPISPNATKASLLAMYYLLIPSKSQLESHKRAIAMRLTEMGLVPTLLELIVDSERSTCEKALGVLEGICSYGDEGREKVVENGLAIPVLVKKLLRVSEAATEFAVSILVKVVADEGRRERVVVEALELGAFQKVLLLLQVGCDERTKEKVTELLKMMNVYRNRVECIDSLDFKHLKRPF